MQIKILKKEIIFPLKFHFLTDLTDVKVKLKKKIKSMRNKGYA